MESLKRTPYYMLILVTAAAVGIYHVHRPTAVAPAIYAQPVSAPQRQKTPTTKLSATPTATAKPKTSTPDWSNEFENTKDWRSTADKVGRAALAGDGRAAMAMAHNAGNCYGFMGGRATPEHRLQTIMASALPDERKALLQQRFASCAALFKNPSLFEDQPRPEGYYADWYFDAEYWRSLAYQERDPEGISIHASLLLSNSKSKPEDLAAVQDDIYQMVDAGNPTALHDAGLILTSGAHPYDSLTNAYALVLAGCRLGIDCVSAETPLSNQPASFEDWASATLPASAYAKVDARAQEIIDAYNQHDTETLKGFAKILPAGK